MVNWILTSPYLPSYERSSFELETDDIPVWGGKDGAGLGGLSEGMVKDWEGVQLEEVEVFRDDRLLVVSHLKFKAANGTILQPRHIESLSKEYGLDETTSLELNGFFFGGWVSSRARGEMSDSTRC